MTGTCEWKSCAASVQWICYGGKLCNKHYRILENAPSNSERRRLVYVKITAPAQAARDTPPAT